MRKRKAIKKAVFSKRKKRPRTAIQEDIERLKRFRDNHFCNRTKDSKDHLYDYQNT